jgi:hypothetical protein
MLVGRHVDNRHVDNIEIIFSARARMLVGDTPLARPIRGRP